MRQTLERPAEAVDSFSALSAAVHLLWHVAILRLASATERVASRFDAWAASNMADGSFVREARDLVTALVDFLDELEADPDLEGELLDDDSEELEDDDPREDDGTAEPSLGSLERHPTLYTNGRDTVGDQTDWAAGNRRDLEDEFDGREPDTAA